MEAAELLRTIKLGESSTVQFKERVPHGDSLAQEMVAFSNTRGGRIIFGVEDKSGSLNGLSYEEVHAINQLLANVASTKVFPSVFILTEAVEVDGHTILVADIPAGVDKPYKDRNGTIWLKNGADKRKVTSNEEIARLLQTSKWLFADELPVHGTSLADINKIKYEQFIIRKYGESLADLGTSIEKSMQGLSLYKDGALTLAGVLLFCDHRHTFQPLHTIHGVKMEVDYKTGAEFMDTEAPLEGDLHTVFQEAMGFINRNMRKLQSGPTFNSPGVWEIPRIVFEELLVNALIHRDYFIPSTIKIFIYKDRVEIHSPGKLTNSLTIENIKNGISISRNPILHSLAQHVLPYKGLGTGIVRALQAYPAIELINDTSAEQFRVVIQRPA